MKNKKIIIISTILVIFLAVLVLGLYIYSWEYRKPLFEVYFLSLNKGRSTFVRTPENKTFLIGAGQNSEVIQEITKLMPFYQRKINTIVITSAAQAQVGGFIEVINRYEVDQVIMPKIMATSTVLAQLRGEIRKKKIHIKEVERGDDIEIEKNVSMKVLFPYSDYKFNKSSLPELGFSISYSSTTAYFIGNLSKTIQKDIARDMNIVNSDPIDLDNKNSSKDIKSASNQITKHDQNLVEFYNTGSDTKVSADLIEILKPKFVFTTKEKAAHFASDGVEWARK